MTDTTTPHPAHQLPQPDRVAAQFTYRQIFDIADMLHRNDDPRPTDTDRAHLMTTRPRPPQGALIP
jgi:hypothetical protein